MAVLGITRAEVKPRSLSAWLSWATQVQLYKAWGGTLSSFTVGTHRFLYIGSSKHKAIQMGGLWSAQLILGDSTAV